MTDIALLRRKRGIIKQKLTSFIKYADKVKQLYNDSDKTLSVAELIKVELRLSQIEIVYTDFNELQYEIELLESDDDQTFVQHADEREEFEDSYFDVVSEVKAIIRSINEPLPGNNTSITSNHSGINDANIVPSQAPISQNHVKLPTINLQKFMGNYESWLEYRDTFESLIHNNTRIGSVEKFHYLRASLEGSAAQVIKSIQLSANNYNIAWNLLCERFNNNKLLIHHHIKSLFNLATLSKESSTDLHQLINDVTRHICSLNALEAPTSHWDMLIIHLVVSKLDRETTREWEELDAKSEHPQLADLLSFLKQKAHLIEKLEHNQIDKIDFKHRSSGLKSKPDKTFFNANQKCVHCKGSHGIYKCETFLKLSVNSRWEVIKRLKLCMNCLRIGHYTKECQSLGCRKCSKMHNTLLHSDEIIETPSIKQNMSMSSHNIDANVHQVLLCTAMVNFIDENGTKHLLRCLLDSGSQSNFISEKCMKRLRLNKTPTDMSIIGINQVVSNITHKCNVEIQSRHNAFKTTLSCFILPHISENIPSSRINIISWKIPNYLRLADPNFNEPRTVDILIGAGTFWHLICIGQVHLGKNNPIMQKTKLGWIISGSIIAPVNKLHCNYSSNVDVQQQLAKFWEIEETSSTPALSCEQIDCETHFINTIERNCEGRFIVSIPLKDSLSKLGDSRQLALRRFYSLERKFQANPKLKERYIEFMKEYESLNHMTRVDDTNDYNPSFYLPHHGVIKETSITTKLRVVFNGSCASDSGWSINQLQMVGPTIQEDLFSILLRFRKHTIVISADIAQMYRQVLVAPQFRALQRIFWRSEPTDQLSVYNLNTVTYGTASAPFLAIRSLKQLAIENADKYPSACKVINEDFYVDDLLTGADSEQDVINISKQVSSILKSGCFELRKWSSNKPSVLEQIQDSTISSYILQFGIDESTKTLGIFWSPQLDVLIYKIGEPEIKASITKRSILSDIGQIFDPLGLLSPCIITAKILLQKLWLLKLTWDESIPMDMHTKWFQFRSDLLILNQIKIPRHVICESPISIELHGFCDASQDAYGAVFYLRSVNSINNVVVNLLCAKTRVSPLKSITIPRLELCGALILAQLFKKVRSSIHIEVTKCVFWCDSTIVLGWIRSQPNELQTFVSNRVAEIQRLTVIDEWRHVRTADNPADYLSRGINPKYFRDLSIWWHGPNWLLSNHTEWPVLPIQNNEKLPEMKKVTINYITNTQVNSFWFNRFSTLNKLKRVTAYCLRFKFNLSNPIELRRLGPLTVLELNNTFKIIIKIAQLECFLIEIKALKNNPNVTIKGKLSALNAFLDHEGILRVGGRLRHSNYTFDKKHPAILTSNHFLTKLIFEHEHKRLLHGGAQLLLATVREEFWPLQGRNLARKTVRMCTTCTRTAPVPLTPIMADLPERRVSPAPPFSISGVDYAGPLFIKDKKGRGAKLSKCYICLFVCFVTKAIHLELVTELTTAAFLASFRRFAARRGKPAHIYSDNGTNFTGAQAELSLLRDFLKKSNNDVSESLSSEGITWHFIPAHAPHFGGLWEAGIKSTKLHLNRIISNVHLTFEELYTVLTQIEAILNSRPLSPLSSDPNDLEALTPSHFLIGRPLTSLPDPDLLHIPQNRLSRFQFVQQLNQHFWTRWSKEYLSELQVRSKWKKTHGNTNVEVGSLVVIKDDRLPPSKWQLGRIIQQHPGSDGVVRVVSVNTITGVIKRALSKVCPLYPEA